MRCSRSICLLAFTTSTPGGQAIALAQCQACLMLKFLQKSGHMLPQGVLWIAVLRRPCSNTARCPIS